MTSERNLRMARLLVVALAALAAPFVVMPLGSQMSYILDMSVIFCIVAVALNLLTGFSGQVSLGHAAFLMVGEYVSSLLTLNLNWSFWIALPLSAVVTGILGFLIGLPAVRLSGNFLAVATMGFSFAVPELALKWSGLTNGSSGLMPLRPALGSYVLGSDQAYYFLILACLVVQIIVIKNLLKSRTGRAFQAIRDSEIAAQSSGVRVGYNKALVFSISAGFTGIAGSLYAHYINFVSPNDFTVQDSFLFLAMIVVGGLASISGSILGAIVINTINQLSSSFGQYSIILVGAVMVLAVLLFPKGLVSLRVPPHARKPRHSSRGSVRVTREVESPDVP